MHALRYLVPVLVLLAAPSIVRAQLDAPTGVYGGTLLHERKLILKQTNPPRVVSFKKKTKLAGFGYVPQGQTRTYIRLIVPPAAHFDAGLDRQLTVDFNPDPPVFEVSNGTGVLPFPFPTITVDGNAVTVSTFVGVNTPDYEIDELNTLSLKRKP